MSFSFSATDLMTTAAQIFNGLFPAFAVIAGIGLGFGILKYVVKAIQDAF